MFRQISFIIFISFCSPENLLSSFDYQSLSLLTSFSNWAYWFFQELSLALSVLPFQANARNLCFCCNRFESLFLFGIELEQKDLLTLNILLGFVYIFDSQIRSCLYIPSRSFICQLRVVNKIPSCAVRWYDCVFLH